jgi:hypothetical protein
LHLISALLYWFMLFLENNNWDAMETAVNFFQWLAFPIIFHHMKII